METIAEAVAKGLLQDFKETENMDNPDEFKYVYMMSALRRMAIAQQKSSVIVGDYPVPKKYKGLHWTNLIDGATSKYPES